MDAGPTGEATRSSQLRWKKWVPGRLCSAPVPALQVSSPDRKHWLAAQQNTEHVQSWKKNQTEEKTKVVAAGWGKEVIQLHGAIQIQHQDVKKWMISKTATWRNGCFGKMDDHPFHTTPNDHPPKMDVLPKTFHQNILAPKWLVRYSIVCVHTAATTFVFNECFQ